MTLTTSARRPRTWVAVVLAALALGSAGALAPGAAEAATRQGFCSSRGSVIGSVIELRDARTGSRQLLYRGECTFITRGQTRVSYRGAKSYRVGYNFGPYSRDCRTNNDFIPWSRADTIYLRLYTTSSCVNP